jgi:GNAT superfamily N-acetyltransferase
MPECQLFEEFSAYVNVTIRTCVREDLPNLEWFGLFSEHREIIHSAFARQEEHGDNVMLVAEANGFPIGQAWIDFVKRRDERCALLWAVRVLPPFQGMSIGARLVQAAERIMRQRGTTQAEVVRLAKTGEIPL